MFDIDHGISAQTDMDLRQRCLLTFSLDLSGSLFIGSPFGGFSCD